MWTQYERKIRHAMKQCFKVPETCHEVHDAVYAYEIIGTKFIENQVETETGFQVHLD